MDYHCAGDCGFVAIVQVPGFETDWVPLSQAIFQFCIEDNPELQELYQKPLNQLTESDIAELREAPLLSARLQNFSRRRLKRRRSILTHTRERFRFALTRRVGHA